MTSSPLLAGTVNPMRSEESTAVFPSTILGSSEKIETEYPEGMPTACAVHRSVRLGVEESTDELRYRVQD